MRLFFCFLAAAMTAALVQHARRERLPLIASIVGGVALLAYLHAKADIAIATSVVVLIAAATRIRPAIAAAVFAELWLAIHDWNPIRPIRELYPRTPIIEAITRLQGHQPYRMAGLGGALFPNTQVLFGLEDARVHDPMATSRYARTLGAAMPYTTGEYYWKFTDANAPMLDTLNVKWLVTDPGVALSGKWKLLYDSKDGRIYENPTVKPRFEGATIVKAEGDEYELKVDAPHETMVKASLAFWPGWRVKHNGKSIKTGMVDGAFLGFVVPGSGTVKVKYMPQSFVIGLIAALAAIAALPIIRRACSTRPGST